MNFPLTRHDQRYEYVLNMGYVDDRTVLDIGCGANAYGAMMLTAKARAVIGIDPSLKPDTNNVVWARATSKSDAGKIQFCVTPVEGVTVEGPTDNSVAVCIEVIEHVVDVVAFVKHVSTLAKWAFYTTPLAAVTGETRNPEHVAEYSHLDLMRILDTVYHIRDIKYQTGDMRIVKDTKPKGDSMDPNHIVQMVWCERKG